jgi:NADH-quinone oxidoreductase subunit G
VRELPHHYGRDTGQIVEAAAAGELGALLVAGVGVEDLPDPARARQALDRVGFLVSFELRPSEVSERADVVFPVAAVAEKPGTFLNWEGRPRPFEAALKPEQMTTRLAPDDARVLHMLADEMDVVFGLPDIASVRREIDALGTWDGPRATPPFEPSKPLPRPGADEAILAGHRLLLDRGRLQDGDEALAGTRHAAVARLSPATAAETGVASGGLLTVTGPGGAVTLPLQITRDLPDRVVWLPLGSTPESTGAPTGTPVAIAPAATATAAEAGPDAGLEGTSAPSTGTSSTGTPSTETPEVRR